MPFAHRDEAKVFWDSEGKGPPVLLIQGLGTQGSLWFRVVPYLSDAYRVIWLDNRGTGRTGLAPEPYTIEMMADDAAAVLDDAGEETAHVVGASMGGIIAQELCLRHPARVRSLALVCTFSNDSQAVGLEPGAMRQLGDRGALTQRQRSEAAAQFAYASDTDRKLIEEDLDARMECPTSSEGYLRQLHAVQSHEGTYDRLPAISVPTLVLHGTSDGLIDPQNATLLADRIPGARVQLIEGASHMLFTDRTDEASTAVRRFLDEVTSRG